MPIHIATYCVTNKKNVWFKDEKAHNNKKSLQKSQEMAIFTT